MDTVAKLKDLAAQMHLEPAEEVASFPRPITPPTVAPCGQVVAPGAQAKKEALGIFNASIAGGKTAPLLKTLLTSACERNCYYCPFRAGRNYRRTTFKPEEMAKTFMDMHRAGMVQGLFLSSGIIGGGVKTQDKFRDYGFDLEELPFMAEGNLPLDIDPKLAWAQANLSHAPVEINRASRQELLRVPGIGPKGAASILAARRQGKLHYLRDLQIIGVRTARLASFVLLDGKQPLAESPRQLRLF